MPFVDDSVRMASELVVEALRRALQANRGDKAKVRRQRRGDPRVVNATTRKAEQGCVTAMANMRTVL